MAFLFCFHVTESIGAGTPCVGAAFVPMLHLHLHLFPRLSVVLRSEVRQHKEPKFDWKAERVSDEDFALQIVILCIFIVLCQDVLLTGM